MLRCLLRRDYGQHFTGCKHWFVSAKVRYAHLGYSVSNWLGIAIIIILSEINSFLKGFCYRIFFKRSLQNLIFVILKSATSCRINLWCASTAYSGGTSFCWLFSHIRRSGSEILIVISQRVFIILFAFKICNNIFFNINCCYFKLVNISIQILLVCIFFCLATLSLIWLDSGFCLFRTLAKCLGGLRYLLSLIWSLEGAVFRFIKLLNSLYLNMLWLLNWRHFNILWLNVLLHLCYLLSEFFLDFTDAVLFESINFLVHSSFGVLQNGSLQLSYYQ